MRLRLFIVELKYWFSRKRENTSMWVARHLPKELRKWVVVYAAVKACGSNKSPCEIGYREMHDAV